MFKQLASNRAFHILYLMSYKLPRHYLALQYIYIFFECPHLNLAGIFMYLLDVHENESINLEVSHIEINLKAI